MCVFVALGASAWAILSSEAEPLCKIFPHYLEKKNPVFGGGTIEYKMCVSSFSTSFVWNIFILRRTEQDMIKKCIGFHIKYALFLSDFDESWIYSTDFRKIIRCQFNENSSSGSRVVPCGQTDGRTDGRTDMTKLTVALRNFANAPKNW